MYQLPDLLQKQLILAVEANASIFPAGWLVHLYTNDLTPTRTTLLGDLTELTNVEVPGYVPVAGAWAGTPVRKQDGSWEDQGTGPIPFAATGAPPAPQIVYGWFATDAGATVLIGSGRFDLPFTFVNSGDGMLLEQVLNAAQANDTDYTLHFDMEQE